MSRPGDPWDELNTRVEALLKDVGRISAVAVNSPKIKASVKDAVQFYFRKARPSSISAGVSESDLKAIDEAMQELNALALGNNRKSSYQAKLKICRTEISALGVQRDILAGTKSTSDGFTSSQQERIIETLEAMLPVAAASLRQAIADLSSSSRISYRGTAAELREVLRDVIDQLAPDATVAAASGFQLEKGRVGPTVRQKVRFVMKSRGRGSTVTASTEDALAGADAMVRSLYNRGSAATHTAREKLEVRRILAYTEAILIDLLEIE
ncbi:MAG: pPIWI-associating nuclease domain-containing protein [Burkholderiales bacterium]